MARVYIAGPMRGHKLYNFPAFDAAANKLLDLEWDVVSPADLDREDGFDPIDLPDDTDWHQFAQGAGEFNRVVERDLQELIQCSHIYLLKGWEQSKGARAEKAVADWCGIAPIYQMPLPATSVVDWSDVKPVNGWTEAKAEPVDILTEALELTSGDRNNQYGPPEQDFTRTAAMWSQLLGCDVKARQVALCMIALKLSRETHQCKRDNWVDIAGYARCGFLCGDK